MYCIPAAAITKTPFEYLCAFLLFLLTVAVVEQLWCIVLLNIFQHFRNIYMYANYTKVQCYLMVFGNAQKGFKHWILNRFFLVSSEIWIQSAMKLPQDLVVCQKTVGNLARDFYRCDERKTQTFWIRTALKSPTTPCKWWKSHTSPWETITVRIGLKTTGHAFWRIRKLRLKMFNSIFVSIKLKIAIGIIQWRLKHREHRIAYER